jgi:hypothetical protein
MEIMEVMEVMGIETLDGSEDVADVIPKPETPALPRDIKVALIKSPRTQLPPVPPRLHDLHVLQG